LAGDHGPTILRSVSILSLYALVLAVATHCTLRKTLD